MSTADEAPTKVDDDIEMPSSMRVYAIAITGIVAVACLFFVGTGFTTPQKFYAMEKPMVVVVGGSAKPDATKPDATPVVPATETPTARRAPTPPSPGVLSLSAFHQMLFDEYRAAVTENNTDEGIVDVTKVKSLCLKYENGATHTVTNVKRFQDDQEKYRRKETSTGNDEMMFVAGGDWGHKLNRKGQGRSMEITSIMESKFGVMEGVSRKLAFGVLLGDNWYPAGLKSVNDRRAGEFDYKFLKFPRLRIPYYVTIGNHDSYGSAEAQLELSLKNPMWNCPGFQYISPVIRRGDITAQIFVLNTRLHFDQNFPLIPPQAPWLDSALGNSTAMWKIVMTHEPIWSFVMFEHERALMQHIHPILMKHQVPLYLAGHAHSLSFFQCPGGYYQLTSGSMNMVPQRNIATRRPKGGFSLESGYQHVVLTAKSMTVVATSWRSQTLWTTEVPLDAKARLAQFESPDPWLWKHKPQCEAHMPVRLPGC